MPWTASGLLISSSLCYLALLANHFIGIYEAAYFKVFSYPIHSILLCLLHWIREELQFMNISPPVGFLSYLEEYIQMAPKIFIFLLSKEGSSDALINHAYLAR